jgi:hypothetical protein
MTDSNLGEINFPQTAQSVTRASHECNPLMPVGEHTVGAAELMMILLVGLPRFELGTSCTPSKRDTRLRYSPTLEIYFSF